MRPEKKYLVQEINDHLDKSNYFFLTDYSGVNVSEAAEIRMSLAAHGAEYHVVKNRLLNIALKEREIAGTDEFFSGPTALVVVGDNPSGAAKVIAKFIKDKEKFTWKGGAVGNDIYDPAKINLLKNLPSIEVLRAQLMGLLNTPARKLVGTLGAAQRDLVSVLSQKGREAA